MSRSFVVGLAFGLALEAAFNFDVIEAYKAKNAELEQLLADQNESVRMCNEAISAINGRAGR